MSGEVFAGILIPLLGTAAGAGCVFFMRKSLSGSLEKALLGFASGVMVAGLGLVSADTCHGYGGKYGKIRVGSRGGGLFAGALFF